MVNYQQRPDCYVHETFVTSESEQESDLFSLFAHTKKLFVCLCLSSNDIYRQYTITQYTITQYRTQQ